MKYCVPFLFVALFLVACVPSPVNVRVVIDGDVHEKIVEEFKKNLSSFVIDEQNILLVDFDSMDKKERKENKKMITLVLKGSMLGETEAGIVLNTKIYAPYTTFYEPVVTVLQKEIDDESYPIKLLDDIILPEKALAVEGLYPDDGDYPLVFATKVFFPDLGDLSEVDSDFTGDGQGDKEADYKKKMALQLADSVSAVYEGADVKSPVSFIAFAGDILAGRGVDRTFEQENGVKKVFGTVLPIIQNSDLSLGNLEGAITEHKIKVFKSYNFKFPYSVLPRLKEAGFSYLSSANNHSFDYGLQGFTDTLLNLEKAGIATSGAGENLKKALKPWQTKIGDTKINVFSLADYPPEIYFVGKKETEVTEDSAGVLWPSDALFQTIRQYDTESILVDESTDQAIENLTIVLVHGGFEWVSQPSERQLKLYRELTAAGADIVVGSHPHVLQPIEVSEEKGLIAYSIGNFIFPGMGETEYGEETIVLEIGLYKGDIKYVNIYPVNLSDIGVSLDTTKIIEKRFYAMNESWNEVKPEIKIEMVEK